MSEAASRLRAIAAAAAAAAERWPLPSVAGPIVGARRDRADDDGAADAGSAAERARGYAAGLEAARAETQRLTSELETRVKHLDSVLAGLARPLAELDEDVTRQLVVLALCIAKQLARREIKANPAEIIGLIRESIGRLPASAREVRVHLHPEDAAVVREHLSAPAAELAWTLVEDPTQSRGGCLVRSESSQIDARFESRVAAVVSALLGDERAGDRSNTDPDRASVDPPASGTPT
jgi:flagellar assembly protein FliH